MRGNHPPANREDNNNRNTQNLVDMSSGGGALGSGHNLTADREFRYVVQWFTEWSDFQREDFVPVLATYLAQGNPGGPVYVNGIISGMANVSGQDKPMSLFQCRVSSLILLYSLEK